MKNGGVAETVPGVEAWRSLMELMPVSTGLPMVAVAARGRVSEAGVWHDEVTMTVSAG